MQSKLVENISSNLIKIRDLPNGVLAVISDDGDWLGSVIVKNTLIDSVFILNGKFNNRSIDFWKERGNVILNMKVRVLEPGEKLELFNEPQEAKK